MTDVSAVPDRVRARLAFWALAGVALFIAHDAIYLVQIGPGRSLVEALRTAGHGYWAWASLALATAALLAAAATWLRIRRLERQASALGAARGSTHAFGRRFARAWWRLAAIVAISFGVQENVEHVIAHGHALGAEALIGPEHPLALPVIGLITAIAAACAALIGGAQDALIVAIEAALRRRIRAPRQLQRPATRLVAVFGSTLARPGAGRAPPPPRVASAS